MGKLREEFEAEVKKNIDRKREKLGRGLSREEKKTIVKKVFWKHFKRDVFGGIALGLGILTGVNTAKTINAPQDDKKIEIDNDSEKDTSKSEDIDFKNGLHVKIDEKQASGDEEIDYDKIMDEIIDEYNQKYDEKLSKEDLGYIKSRPQFLGIDENGEYIQDYKQKEDVDSYLTAGIGEIYVVINKEDNSVIGSLGKVEGEITNVDTKIVMDGNRKEYLEGEKKIDLTKDSDNKEIDEKSIENRYKALANEYQKVLDKDKDK